MYSLEIKCMHDAIGNDWEKIKDWQLEKSISKEVECYTNNNCFQIFFFGILFGLLILTCQDRILS